MKSLIKLLSLGIICGALTAGAAAYADTIILQDKDRELVREYVVKTKGCPPGTVMQEKQRYFGLVHPYHNCVPQGNATVTVYSPGTIIPETVTYTELPSTIVSELPAPPAGEVYVSTNNAVYLVNPRTRTVVDTVSLYNE